jgi:hypothetical protein
MGLNMHNSFFPYRSTEIEEIETVATYNLIFPMPLYHKMLSYARASNGEISGFGRTHVHRVDEGTVNVHIKEIRIFEQVVSSGHTRLESEALHNFYHELLTENKDPMLWNLWWHSHNDFHVFFSSTDTDTIEELSTKKKLYSLCINKKGETVARFDENAQHMGDMEVKIQHVIDPALTAACQQEVAQKIKYNSHNLWNNNELPTADGLSTGFQVSE